MTPEDKKQMEECTQQLLRSTKLISHPVDIPRIAASLSIDFREEDLESEVSGILFVKDGVKRIVVNYNHELKHRRAAIAYILGLLHLHQNGDDELIIFNKINFYQRARHSSGDIQEIHHRDAVRFAMCLMMPEPWIRSAVFNENKWSDQDIAKLAHQYLVSEQLMLMRLVDLDVMIFSA